jgi:DNA-binding NarL/FixJ family response regulator
MATRILIADDHELMRAVLRNLINAHEGWHVCAEATNGSEAVVQEKKLHPDLIVLDLAMPVMDGMQAAREIRKNTPRARMVMFTLHASPEVEQHAKQVGVTRVVSKAKNGGRLVTAIEQVLDERGGQESDSETDDTEEYTGPVGGESVREIRVHQQGLSEGRAAQNAAERQMSREPAVASESSGQENAARKSPETDDSGGKSADGADGPAVSAK